jgi:hypothetical protein
MRKVDGTPLTRTPATAARRPTSLAAAAVPTFSFHYYTFQPQAILGSLFKQI